MKKSSIATRRQSEQGGFALLMVFLMAAIVALMLYQQLPRVAFESEREKEQLLIDRGEQYTRAIQLYYMANNRQWPTSIDDLEKREKRFLRRRYVDPYTGKDEWRIIHTTGGFLTDSLVQKPLGDSGTQSASNTTATDGQPQVNAAVLQRPSDRPVTPLPGFGQAIPEPDPTGQQQGQQQQPGNTALPPITLQPQQGPGALPPITLQVGGNQPGGLPPITLAPPAGAGGQQVPGQIPGQFRPGGVAPVTGQPSVSPFPGQVIPGGLPGASPTPAPPGFRIDANGQLVPVPPVPGPVPPGISGQPQNIPGQPLSPQAPNQPGAQGSPNAALNLINQLLTNPRQTTSTTASTGGNQVGGIAGIASTHKGPSIKVYKDQTQYELWEFVFTPTASTVPGGGNGGVGGPNGPGRGGPNQPGNQPTPFGTQPSPFGTQPGPFGNPGQTGGRGGQGQPGTSPTPFGR